MQKNQALVNNSDSKNLSFSHSYSFMQTALPYCLSFALCIDGFPYKTTPKPLFCRR